MFTTGAREYKIKYQRNKGSELTIDYASQYPDGMALAKDELSKMDDLLEKVDEWKDGRFQEELYAFSRKFDESAQTAMIIRALESQGYKGLPNEMEIIHAMFTLIENTAAITFHLILNEDIRL